MGERGPEWGRFPKPEEGQGFGGHHTEHPSWGLLQTPSSHQQGSPQAWSRTVTSVEKDPAVWIRGPTPNVLDCIRPPQDSHTTPGKNQAPQT